MLTRLTVNNFKSLADVELEPGQVNVFVGANGSGKSNLLEAIATLSALIEWQKQPPMALLQHGARPASSSMLFSCFKGTENRESKIAVNEISGWSAALNLHLKYINIVKELTFDTDIQPKEADVSILSSYAIFSPITPVLRGTMPDYTQQAPVGLTGGRLAEAVGHLLDNETGMFGTLELEDLLELLDWVDEIAVVPPSRELIDPNVPTTQSIIRFTDRWMRESDNQLSAYNASEGVLYVLFALVLAMHPESPRLFAIDNFDHAMHPRLARATTRIFCQEILKTDPPRQAFLTTHNPLVLDGLDLRNDRIRLFSVDRDTDGATKVRRIQVSDDIVQNIEDGLSLSDLWIMGRLGGVPDIF